MSKLPSRFMRNVIARATGSARKAVRKGNTRLRIESLEDRSVPATFTVTTTADTGAGSLRQAVLDANASAGVADDIVFDAATFNTPQTIQLATAITVTSAGGPLTITGPGTDLLTVTDAGGTNQLFNAATTAASVLTMTDFTMANVNAAVDGGALQVTFGVLERMAFLNNATTQQGGAIRMNTTGNLTIRDSTFTGNSAATGGGIYVFSGGTLVVERSTFNNNNTTGAGNALGGSAIYWFGTATSFVVRNSTIANNTATGAGAGILAVTFTGNLLVENSTITGNTSGSRGAGISVNSGAGTVTVANSVVAGNNNLTAPNIFSANTTNVNFSAINDTTGFTLTGANNYTGTFASMLLGALADNGGPTETQLPLTGSPLLNAGSDALFTGAPSIDQRGANRLNGTIDIGAVERQVTDEAPPSAVATAPDVTVDGTTTVTITVVYTDLEGTIDGIDTATLDGDDLTVSGPGLTNEPVAFVGFDDTDPNNVIATYTLTVPAGFTGADNGSYTIDLVAGEVEDGDGNAIDAGTIGSFSVAIPVVIEVTNANDSGAGSLRDALAAVAAAGTDDVITFDPVFFATPQTITLLTALPAITNGGLQIIGPGSDLLTITRDAGAANFRILSVASLDTQISGVTITNGVAANSFGGGIGVTAYDVNLELDDVVVSGNSATGTPAFLVAAGGGIGGTARMNLTLRNSTVSGNTAVSNGGGLYFFSNGTLLMENSTISGNTTTSATASYGGGAIYLFGSTTAPWVIRNSTIANNTSGSSGGGILLRNFLDGATTATEVFIESSTIVGNTATNTAATQGGGGIATVGGAATGVIDIVNSVVAGNNNTAAPDILGNAAGLVVKNFSAIGSVTGFTDNGGTGNIAPGTPLLLGPLQDNGGPTFTMLPGTGSPLIDAGDDASIVLPTDQRGEIRIVDTVDIGSVEVQVPPFTVTVEQTVGQADPVLTGPITFDIEFSEDTTDFDLSDITIGGTFAGTYDAVLNAIDGNSYQLVIDNLEAGQQGTFEVSIADAVATNPGGDDNEASTSVDNVVTVDLAPTVVVTPDAALTNGDASFTVTFNEPVTGFDETDVVLDPGTLGGSATIVVTPVGPLPAAVYTVTVSGLTGVGTVGISIPAGAAFDTGGAANPNEASNTDATVDVDTVVPTVVLTPVDVDDPTYGSSVSFTATFSEDVTGFDSADVVVGGTAVGGTAVVTPVSGSVYTITVSGFTAGGTVTVSVPAAAGQDAAGNDNTAATGDGSTDLVLTGTVQFSAPTYTVTEEGLVATVTVTRTGGTEGELTVDYATTAGTAGTGDFTAATGTLTFPAGSAASQDITITLLNDQLDEADETFTVTLSNVEADGNPVAGALGTPSVATVTITGLEPPAIFLNASTVTLTEGGAANQLLVNRVGDNTLAATADYTITFAGSASGADFTAPLTGTVTFAAGSSVAQPIDLSLLDDSLNEGNETFTITLSNFTGTPAGTPVSATGTIAPSDGAASKVAVTDDDGDTVTVIGSKGTVLTTYLTDPDGDGRGPIELIDVTTSTLKSKVTIKVKTPKGGTGNGLVEVGDISAGALGTVAGAKARLTGDVTATGAVKALIFADVQDGSSIEAGSLAKLITKGNKKAGVAGDFTSDVTLNGPGVGNKGITLGALTVKGVISDSTFDITGNVNKVKAAGFVDSTMDVTGSINNFTITGLTNAFASSDVTASSVKTVVLKSANTANGGVPFGFTVDVALTSLKLGKPVSFTYKAAVDGLVNGGDKSTGDFTVDVV